MIPLYSKKLLWISNLFLKLSRFRKDPLTSIKSFIYLIPFLSQFGLKSGLLFTKLSLHLGKTECILFGPKRKLKNFNDFTICYNNHVIKSTDHVKYLGVYIDNSLSGDYIVDSVAKKVNGRLKFLYRQAKFLDFTCKMSLCSALIQCHLDYACSAWYSGLSKCLKKKLQICQNKMVRFILDYFPRQSVNYDVLSSINMLSVEDRVKQLRLNHVFNIFHQKAPTYMQDNFVLKTARNNGRQKRSVSNLDFNIPRVSSCQSIYLSIYLSIYGDRSKINDSAIFRQKYRQSIISRFPKGLIKRKMLVYTHIPPLTPMPYSWCKWAMVGKVKVV